jgi:hypothetical protein
MPVTKYGKYIKREPLGTFADLHPELTGIENFRCMGKPWGVNYSVSTTAIDKPFLMEPGPHVHPYDEFLCFIAGNPMNLRDFGAEIELCLGEEQEKHIINSSTAVYIPKELPHCPLNFKVIKKPIVFMVVMLGDYIKKPVPKK